MITRVLRTPDWCGVVAKGRVVADHSMHDLAFPTAAWAASLRDSSTAIFVC